MSLNRFSSPEDKRNTDDAVFSFMSDVLFNKINLLNNPGLATSTATTSQTLYRTLLRVSDTSEGLYLRPDKLSRFRSQFYVTGAPNATAYILSPVMYDSLSLGTNISSLESFSSYVGLYINGSQTYIVSKINGKERLRKTDFVIKDDTTNIIEIVYNVTNAEVIINNNSLGSIECDLTRTVSIQKTFMPLFAPIKSKNGSSVNMNMEGYQFLQDK